MRRRAKLDRNHPEIVAALRAAGCSVQSLAAVGKGCPDVLVARNGVNYLLEIKDMGSSRKDALTTLENQWHRAWRGVVSVVRTVDEALAVVLG